MMQGIYGALEQPHDVTLEPSLIVLALGGGVLASMVSAALPARSASRVDPAVALQKGGAQAMSVGENRNRQIAALVLAMVSASCLIWSDSRLVFYAGYLLIAVVAVLLTPTLAPWLARILRRAFTTLRPVEGALAVDSIIQSPRRTSATVSALMFSLAMAIGLGGLARSTNASVEEWVSATFNAPLFVSTSEGAVQPSFHFPAAMIGPLQEIQGIEEVQPVRNLKVSFRGAPIALFSTNLSRFAARTRGRHVAAGNYDEMHRLASQGKGVIVSENFSLLQKLGMGNEVELATSRGTFKLPIVGIVKDYTEQEGTIFIDRSVFARYWDDSADSFRIYLKPGASAEAVRSAILNRFEHERRLFVFSSQEVKNYIMRVVSQWFSMTYIQMAIAVLVSVLGILNTLTVSITERKRELGVLRAIGGLNSQVRHTIWMEAFAVGLIGLILGFALGGVNLYYTLQMVRRDFTGMPLEYQYPHQIALLLIPIIVMAAFLAALAPAEYAVRTPLVQALEYE